LTLLLYRPCLCCQFIFCGGMWYFCLYLYCHWKSNYFEVGIPLTDLASPHICTYPNPGRGLPTSYVLVFFMINDLRREVVVCFIDIGGNVNHHCWNFALLHNHSLEVSGFKRVISSPTLIRLYILAVLKWNWMFRSGTRF
jgi:hypothetical protein